MKDTEAQKRFMNISRILGFQHERADTLSFFKTEDRADVRMIKRGQYSRFPLEAAEPLRIVRERARQDFDRHITPELRVASTIDFPHTARAEQVEDLVGPEARASGENHGLPILAIEPVRAKEQRTCALH
jgi:hypothetical protein